MLVEISGPCSWLLVARSVQALFGVILLGLTGSVVSNNESQGSSSNTANFYLFVCCWTLLVALPYLVFFPKYFPGRGHYAVPAAMEALTTIFWLSGSIAVGAGAQVGGYCQSTDCKTMSAALAFGVLEILLFGGTTGKAIFEAKEKRARAKAEAGGAA